MPQVPMTPGTERARRWGLRRAAAEASASAAETIPEEQEDVEMVGGPSLGVNPAVDRPLDPAAFIEEFNALSPDEQAIVV